MDKYGFIYIWYNSWKEKFYIGCHWGREDDGYICSSSIMRKAYKRTPQNFKRRILARVYDRSKLLEEEHKWLALIKDEELGTKYYNLSKKHFGHWSATDNTLTIREKMSRSWTLERRTQYSQSMKGNRRGSVPCSAAKALKISQSQRGRKDPRSLEGKEAHRMALKGNPSPRKGMKQPRSEQQLIEQRLRNERVFAKEWLVEDIEGNKYQVINLNKWCRLKGVSSQSLRYYYKKTNPIFVDGYRLISC